MQNTILDIALNTRTLKDILEQTVNSNLEFKQSQRVYEKAMEQLKSNFTLYESIDKPIFEMVDAAMNAAFKTGFNEGMRFIVSALSGNEGMGDISKFEP